MKAEIKYWISPDVDDLENFNPLNTNNFGFFVQMIIGPLSESGEESFGITICTPDWLKENYNKDEVIFGRHYLIVFQYNYQAIHKKLSEYINSIEADSWEEIANEIGKISYWEFDDYKA